MVSLDYYSGYSVLIKIEYTNVELNRKVIRHPDVGNLFKLLCSVIQVEDYKPSRHALRGTVTAGVAANLGNVPRHAQAHLYSLRQPNMHVYTGRLE